MIAKELAAKGLEILLLERGPRFRNPEQEWSPTDFIAAGNFTSGYVESPHQLLRVHASGVGGTTLRYFGNSPRAMPHVFRGSGADRRRFDLKHAFPFSYRELLPYYRWVEATLPVQTSPLDTKAQIFVEGAQAIGLPVQTSKDITGDAFRPQENAILQPIGNAGILAVLRNRDPV